jgi:hypothetical protein
VWIFAQLYLSVGGFGRRASDGGANLQMFFSRQLEGVWSQPGSQEQLQMVHHLCNVTEIETVSGGRFKLLCFILLCRSYCYLMFWRLALLVISYHQNKFGLCRMGIAIEAVKLSVISVLYTIFLVTPFSYLLIPFPR